MIAVPYTVERRPDTGVNNVKLGVWLFLASEVMLFGGLFSAYFMLRAGAAQPWPPLAAHRWLAIVNTVVLLGAGAAINRAVRAARGRRIDAFRWHMLGAIGLALLFCALKGYEYSDDYAMGWLPSTSTQLATYFLLTGVHALHVAGGFLIGLRLALTRRQVWTASAPVVVNRVEAAAIYWYFVDLIWLILFVLLYVG
jgi:heme/copper-type cytochrome/quinol oxidase subunit 3